MTTFAHHVVQASKHALKNNGDDINAIGAAKYMKNIAPFIGISAPNRRRLLKEAWSKLAIPSSDELGAATKALMALKEREFHYAACDLLDKFIAVADEYFIAEHLEVLLTCKPWWDTIDGFVSAGVSPLCRRYDANVFINEWSESGDRWLIRAAIGHQRGWKQETNVKQILQLCRRHWDNNEFFIAKAIGWALRDIAAIDPTAVQQFLDKQSIRNSIAEREANRGLLRHVM